MVVLALLFFLLLGINIIHGLSTSYVRIITRSSNFALSKTSLYSKKDGIDTMKLDETKLSEKEKERIELIKKISLEADEMIKNAGFTSKLDDDDDDGIFVEAKDTQWTGQSGMEISRKSSYNFQDLTERWGLAFGDVAVFLGFAAIGRSNHNEDIDLFNTFLTAAPFLISWLILSPFIGAYTRQATSSIQSIPLNILPSLASSTIVGLGIRSLIKGYAPPIVFAILSFVFPFILLCAWRVAYIKLVGSTADGENKEAGAFEVFKMVGTLVKRW